MKLIIQIDASNAAFEENFAGEVRRILRNIDPEFVPLPGDEEGNGAPLYDINGNRVGFVRLQERGIDK